MRSGTSFLGH
uniref:Uncharacterized protein n=1 Tax=Arundo donax TaxID=35708 RepID=A0A0A9BFC7_ARUDO